MKKNHVYACVACIMLVFAVICFANASENTVKAERTPWPAEGIEHACELSGDEQIVFELTGGYMLAGAGELEKAINDGYMTAYIDTFKAYGLIASDFVPTGNGSNSGSGGSKDSTPVAKSPTLAETEAAAYVVVKSSEVYDGYDGGKKTGATLEPDTEVTVTGYTSNSYYRLEDGTYVPKSGVAAKADYDAAWSVTEEIPATCTEAGSVKRVNTLSGKESEEIIEALGHDYAMTDYAEPTCTEAGYDTYVCNTCGDTYTEELAATGHEAGEPVVTVEPKSFSRGTRTTYCTVCNEVLTEEEIPQTFPIPLWGVIVIAVVVVGGVATAAVLLVRRKRK